MLFGSTPARHSHSRARTRTRTQTSTIVSQHPDAVLTPLQKHVASFLDDQGYAHDIPEYAAALHEPQPNRELWSQTIKSANVGDIDIDVREGIPKYYLAQHPRAGCVIIAVVKRICGHMLWIGRVRTKFADRVLCIDTRNESPSLDELSATALVSLFWQRYLASIHGRFGLIVSDAKLDSTDFLEVMVPNWVELEKYLEDSELYPHTPSSIHVECVVPGYDAGVVPPKIDHTGVKRTKTLASAEHGEAKSDALQRTRIRIFKEFVATEESYLRSINILQTYFQTPLLKLQQIPDSIKRLCFIDLSGLIELHTDFVKALQGLKEEDQSSLCVLFDDYASRIQSVYSKTLDDYQTTSIPCETLKRLETSSFLDSCAETVRRELNQDVNFFNLRAEIMQRLPRYVMLFDRMRDKTCIDDVSYQALCRTCQVADKIASAVLEEKSKNMIELDSLSFLNNLSVYLGSKFIVKNGRDFIMEVEAVRKYPALEAKHQGAHPASSTQIILLFTDCIYILSYDSTARKYTVDGGIIDLEQTDILDDRGIDFHIITSDISQKTAARHIVHSFACEQKAELLKQIQHCKTLLKMRSASKERVKRVYMDQRPDTTIYYHVSEIKWPFLIYPSTNPTSRGLILKPDRCCKKSPDSAWRVRLAEIRLKYVVETYGFKAMPRIKERGEGLKSRLSIFSSSQMSVSRSKLGGKVSGSSLISYRTTEWQSPKSLKTLCDELERRAEADVIYSNPEVIWPPCTSRFKTYFASFTNATAQFNKANMADLPHEVIIDIIKMYICMTNTLVADQMWLLEKASPYVGSPMEEINAIISRLDRSRAVRLEYFVRHLLWAKKHSHGATYSNAIRIYGHLLDSPPERHLSTDSESRQNRQRANDLLELIVDNLDVERFSDGISRSSSRSSISTVSSSLYRGNGANRLTSDHHQYSMPIDCETSSISSKIGLLHERAHVNAGGERASYEHSSLPPHPGNSKPSWRIHQDTHMGVETPSSKLQEACAQLSAVLGAIDTHSLRSKHEVLKLRSDIQSIAVNIQEDYHYWLKVASSTYLPCSTTNSSVTSTCVRSELPVKTERALCTQASDATVLESAINELCSPEEQRAGTWPSRPMLQEEALHKISKMNERLVDYMAGLDSLSTTISSDVLDCVRHVALQFQDQLGGQNERDYLQEENKSLQMAAHTTLYSFAHLSVG
ncbi:uncharacterized protein BJ171DRAFT_623713 [Polychytrium aggregatum]|uniref:uncharacterized protein n=1 Tax=Polychytrium aggregatum TaxID=110093 RepID=UPI0022FED078|nr:uncharacterized protein BJ171DRAFT_623713 [Polychytrium aggregatum]KAI9203448.1 hypothetical protein BJ171DRAFT_623713 [Polychytrium aggregatum]